MTQLGLYLTATEVAERFDITPESVRAWARTKKLRAIKLPGGKYRFYREDVEAIERGEQPASVAS